MIEDEIPQIKDRMSRWRLDFIGKGWLKLLKIERQNKKNRSFDYKNTLEKRKK